MIDIIEIENFIPENYQNDLENHVMSDNFFWFYSKDVTRNNSDVKNPGFSNCICDNQKILNHSTFNLFYPLISEIDKKTPISVKSIIRMRLGLLLRNTTISEYNTPHIDQSFNHFVGLYYLNDTDGDTFVFEQKNELFTKEIQDKIIERNDWKVKEKINPKKGKIAIFDGKHYHASSYPKKNNDRIVLTINFTGNNCK